MNDKPGRFTFSDDVIKMGQNFSEAVKKLQSSDVFSAAARAMQAHKGLSQMSDSSEHIKARLATVLAAQRPFVPDFH